MDRTPKGGAWEKCVHLVRVFSRMNVPLYAANAGFFILLSVFPALVLVLGLLRYTGLQVSSLIDLISAVIPGALMPTVRSLVAGVYENSSGALVGVSAATAVWSASKGVYGLLTGLNAVYGVSEDRGWLHARLISVAYTFAFLGILLLSLVVHVFGGALVALAPMVEMRFLKILFRIVNSRFLLLFMLQTLVFALVFAFLPNGRNRFRDTIPGAVLSSLGWLVFSDLFSVYVEHFASLTNIYGSVYAVALSMLWLYFCLGILFYGAALNQYLEKHKI